MKVKEALHNTAKTLAANLVEEAPLEAELLLMHAMELNRTGLYLRLEDALSSEYSNALSGLMSRRLRREPVAYILKNREFYGLDFCVGPGVLIPRPETETLVEEAIAFTRRNFPSGNPVIADIGTGSGAIAVSLSRLFPKAKVYATDISAQALDIAALNCIRHGVRVELLYGDLLAPLPQPVDIIVANLPYVRDDELAGLSAEIKDYEPHVALAGGDDGLNVIRRLIVDAPDKLCSGGAVLLEIAPSQAAGLASWAAGLGSWGSVDLVRDCGGVGRILKLVLTKR
ncbi:MAG: peptide chain release factor N(5)-glutamine methyltransferase [Dehalococcoidia bacterium]|jgi:release factor glutamine methyltransferase